MINDVSRLHTGVPDDKGTSQAGLEKAAGEFESIFINYILKSMRESQIKGGLFENSEGEEMYKSMLDEELAKSISKSGGIGLKEIIIRDMSGHKEIAPDKKSQINSISVSRAPVYPDNLDKPVKIEEPRSDNNLRPSSEKMRAYEINSYDRFSRPVDGTISSHYGMRNDPFLKDLRFHKGLDIAAPEGTPIYPAERGKVIFSGVKQGYGNVIEIEHENGYITTYAHNQKNLVNKGDMVNTSDVVALVGKTGRATGSHLHFEVKVDGKAINPRDMIMFG